MVLYAVVLQGLLRSYESDMESMSKQHKRQLEEAERAQEQDMRATAKALRSDNVSYVTAYTYSLALHCTTGSQHSSV